MTNSELIGALCDDLRLTYGCHTAILYGSRSRDDWEVTSDIDVIAFRDAGGPERGASRWNGVFLDLFIHSTNDEADPGWIRINGGRVLFQKHHLVPGHLMANAAGATSLCDRRLTSAEPTAAT